MSEKLKFKPVITRIKLNPEQAVLECTCYTARLLADSGGNARRANTCQSGKTLANVKNVGSGARS